MKKIILIVLTVLSISLIGVTPAKAYTFGSGDFKITLTPDTTYGEGEAGTQKAINSIFSAIITIAEIAFIILLLVGGVMYLTSMGDEAGSSKARKLMVDAVIGLVIVLVAWAAGTWIIDRLTGKTTDNGTSAAASSAGGAISSAVPSTGMPVPAAATTTTPKTTNK